MQTQREGVNGLQRFDQLPLVYRKLKRVSECLRRNDKLILFLNCQHHSRGRVESKCMQAGSDEAICSVRVVTVLNSAKQRGNIQISILLLCFLYLFVELMITMNEF